MGSIRKDRALCLGGADCVWTDVIMLEMLYKRAWDGLVIAANDIGAHWRGPLHHWVTFHPSKLQKWMDLRCENGHPATKYITWGANPEVEPPIQRVLKPWPPGGSSGLLAVQVARELGCDKIVLCGIPMTRTPHFPESHEKFADQWMSATNYWRAWSRNKTKMLGFVRSMNGRTREFFGQPTEAWFDDE